MIKSMHTLHFTFTVGSPFIYTTSVVILQVLLHLRVVYIHGAIFDIPQVYDTVKKEKKR